MTLDNMKSTSIPVSALTAQFSLPDISATPMDKHHLLLGQDRVVTTFQLAEKIAEQHLYIADFPGIDRRRFIDALFSANKPAAVSYLVKTSDSNRSSMRWTQERPQDYETLVAEKQPDYCYLSGQIRRSDLIGRVMQTRDGASYQAGALARYHTLFICAESLYRREGLWDLVLQILADKEYRLNDEFCHIPLNCKLVLIGNSYIYSQLRSQDAQFHQHFPLLGELASEIDLARHSESEYGLWLQAIAKSMQLTLSTSALPSLFKYASSLVEHQQRLTLSMLDMVQVLAQANAYKEHESIDATAIDQALTQLRYRHNTSEMYSAQSFDDNFINLPTSGSMIGQVNGLTVIDAYDFSYGEPARITASVHYGDGEVADIERKSELGGNIHAKGMMILSACLYRIFGRDAPLHLNANIVFEQSYQEIDGDSASLAEYCCLMSAIAERPIVQSLAVTGALDQFGNVQAIGGVNEKITGFFNLCERRGLTGEQGVIIPKANVLQLNLEEKIVAAVAAGQFTLHQIEHMDQAVELLMQMQAGVADEDNDFPDDSLYGLVQQRLDRLAGHLEDEEGFFAKLRAKLGFYRD
jgi:Lon-like ATP-dependent protease